MQVFFRVVFLFALPWAAVSTAVAQQAAPPANIGPNLAKFHQLLDQLKDIGDQMEKLFEQYQAARPEDQAPIVAEFEVLQKKGQAIQESLFGVAEKAYLEAPNASEDVIAVMVQVLIGHLKADEYEEVLRKAQLLIENRAPEPGVYGLAGSAAFNLCDFDAAEKYFTLAKENDALGGMAEHFASQVADYKKFWQQEQQIRAAEARADDLPRVLLKTSQGEIELEMLENEAPIAVANFVSLVEKGYYDGLTFHRVIPNFMAQGGCPKGEGTGGPGYNIPCECYQPNFRRHFRGSLSMAHAGRDTGGSQFFLTFGPTSHLDERHTVFGRVVQGFEVLSKIQRRDPQQPDAPTPDRILEAKVLRKRDHQYVPTKVADEFNE